jgi:dynein heavy chain
MRSSGGISNDISMRLKRHFCIFVCNSLTDHTIDRIYGSIAYGYFGFEDCGFVDEVYDAAMKLIRVTRMLWQMTKVCFTFLHWRI